MSYNNINIIKCICSKYQKMWFDKNIQVSLLSASPVSAKEFFSKVLCKRFIYQRSSNNRINIHNFFIFKTALYGLNVQEYR